MEVIVQVIEGLFYIWIIFNLSSVTDITPKRYIDWTITTPTMLVTLIFYLIYSYNREKNTTSNLDFFRFIFKKFFRYIFKLYYNNR